jgi:ferritin-like metal-binding protein YciE
MTARELLVLDLKRLLTVEEMLAKVLLPKLLQEVQDGDLRSALQEHLEQTRGHVRNIREAFERLGERPAGDDAPGLEGLKQEHETGVKQVAPALRDGFDAGAAIGSEHYEIAIYSTALLLAQNEAPDVADLLRANLDEEFAALRKLETAAERLATQASEQPAVA